VVFFLVYQLGLSAILFRNRTGNIPVGFDDLYSYMYGIKKVVDYGSVVPPTVYLYPEAHLDYISYNALFGGLAILIKQSPEWVVYWSFFFGKILLLLVLAAWLKSLKLPTIERGVCLLLLGSFVGDGLIHGFFWVVPSFWAVLLFFLLLYLIKDFRVPYLLLLFLSLVFVNMHPLAKILPIVILIFIILNTLIEKHMSKPLVKLTSVLLLSVLLTETLGCNLAGCRFKQPFDEVKILFNRNNSIGTRGKDYMPSVSLIPKSIGRGLPSGFVAKSDLLSMHTNRWLNHLLLDSTSRLPGFRGIWESYISKFILVYPLVIFLPYWLYLIWRSEYKQVTYWFFATLIALVTISKYQDSYRLLILLWPLTLIVFGLGVVRSFCLQSESNNALFKLFNWFGIISLGVYWIYQSVYGFVFTSNLAKHNDYSWDVVNCPKYILNETKISDYNIFFNSFSGLSAFAYYGLDQRHLTKSDYLLNNIEDVKERYPIIFLVTENFPFEGNSDTVYIPKIETKMEPLKKYYYTYESKNCGYFQVNKYQRINF
jgi:hypothetical protein